MWNNLEHLYEFIFYRLSFKKSMPSYYLLINNKLIYNLVLSNIKNKINWITFLMCEPIDHNNNHWILLYEQKYKILNNLNKTLNKYWIKCWQMFTFNDWTKTQTNQYWIWRQFHCFVEHWMTRFVTQNAFMTKMSKSFKSKINFGSNDSIFTWFESHSKI